MTLSALLEQRIREYGEAKAAVDLYRSETEPNKEDEMDTMLGEQLHDAESALRSQIEEERRAAVEQAQRAADIVRHSNVEALKAVDAAETALEQVTQERNAALGAVRFTRERAEAAEARLRELETGKDAPR